MGVYFLDIKFFKKNFIRIIDLSEYEWNSSPRNNEMAIEFAIKQSSNNLQSLNVRYYVYNCNIFI